MAKKKKSPNGSSSTMSPKPNDDAGALVRDDASATTAAPASRSSAATEWLSAAFLFVVAATLAEGLGREIVGRLVGTLPSVRDPSTRIGIEAALAALPVVGLHRWLFHRSGPPTLFSLALLTVAFGVGDGVAFQVQQFVDPRLVALLTGAVIGVAVAGVVERGGIVAQILFVVAGALGNGARAVAWDAFGTRELPMYLFGLSMLWVAFAVVAYAPFIAVVSPKTRPPTEG